MGVMPRETNEIIWSKVRKKKDVGALVNGAALTEKQATRESQKLKRLLENYVRKYELRKSFLQKYCPHKYILQDGVTICQICDKHKEQTIECSVSNNEGQVICNVNNCCKGTIQNEPI